MNLSTAIKAQSKHLLARNYYKKLIRSHRNQPLYENNIIFIHVPKNAGRALLQSFFGRQAGLGHLSCYQYLCAYGIGDYFAAYKFGFVRNPFRRLISAYHYLTRGGNNSSDAMFRSITLTALRISNHSCSRVY